MLKTQKVLLGFMFLLFLIILTGCTNKTEKIKSGKYADYIWGESNYKANYENNTSGGANLEIKLSGSNVMINLTSLQRPPASRVASTKEQKLTMLDENTGEFTFNDDGWGNKGKGTVLFQENTIVVDIEITDKKADALWRLPNGKVSFTRIDSVSAYKKKQKMIESLGLAFTPQYGEPNTGYPLLFVISDKTRDYYIQNKLINVMSIKNDTEGVRLVQTITIYSVLKRDMAFEIVKKRYPNIQEFELHIPNLPNYYLPYDMIAEVWFQNGKFIVTEEQFYNRYSVNIAELFYKNPATKNINFVFKNQDWQKIQEAPVIKIIHSFILKKAPNMMQHPENGWEMIQI